MTQTVGNVFAPTAPMVALQVFVTLSRLVPIAFFATIRAFLIDLFAHELLSLFRGGVGSTFIRLFFSG